MYIRTYISSSLSDLKSHSEHSYTYRVCSGNSIYLFIYLLIYLFIHSFIQSFIHSFVDNWMTVPVNQTKCTVQRRSLTVVLHIVIG